MDLRDSGAGTGPNGLRTRRAASGPAPPPPPGHATTHNHPRFLLRTSQVADEHGLEVQLGMPAAASAPVATAAPVAAPADDLSSRLAQLRGEGAK